MANDTGEFPILDLFGSRGRRIANARPTGPQQIQKWEEATDMKLWRIASCTLLVFAATYGYAQDADTSESSAGHVPVISGGMGYVHNVNGGVTSLEPQINPILLVPFGSHVLLESRTDFTGFFQRMPQPSGDFRGKVFKSVEYAQLDWLANSHVMVSAGKYLLPFGLYNERLEPIWIRNLQDSPITAGIGLGASGAGDGGMLRGVIRQTPAYSVQYSAYFSASSNINQLQASRSAGGDSSIFFTKPRLELGTSYERLLQGHQINSVATYLSWQAPRVPLDLKLEYDQSYMGRGYWLEGAYSLRDMQKIPAFARRVQLVSRMQQFYPEHGGGSGLPRLNTNRVDFGLNYYVRDDLRFISSYGRQFQQGANANVWNVGFTYRFLMPLWPGRK
jgi:hypothetical protein